MYKSYEAEQGVDSVICRGNASQENGHTAVLLTSVYS